MITVISGAWKDTVGAIKAINDNKKNRTIHVEMSAARRRSSWDLLRSRKCDPECSDRRYFSIPTKHRDELPVREAGGREIPDNTT